MVFSAAFGGLLLLLPYKFFAVKNGDISGALYKHLAALLPAAGVILGQAATGTGQKLPRFAKAYSIVAVLERLCCMGDWLLPGPNWHNAGTNVIYIGSVAVLLYLLQS